MKDLTRRGKLIGLATWIALFFLLARPLHCLDAGTSCDNNELYVMLARAIGLMGPAYIVAALVSRKG